MNIRWKEVFWNLQLLFLVNQILSQELLQCLTEALKLWHGDQSGKVDLNNLSIQDFIVLTITLIFRIRVILEKFHEDEYDTMIERHFNKIIYRVKRLSI